jgi:hypothetical protein
MKKIFALVMVVSILGAALVGCSGDTTADANTNAAPANTTS